MSKANYIYQVYSYDPVNLSIKIRLYDQMNAVQKALLIINCRNQMDRISLNHLRNKNFLYHFATSTEIVAFSKNEKH